MTQAYELSKFGLLVTANSTAANVGTVSINTTAISVGGVKVPSTAYVTRKSTGDNTTVDYTVTTGCTVDNVLVLLDGICQTPTDDYTISSTTLTFTTAPYTGAKIVIRELPH